MSFGRMTGTFTASVVLYKAVNPQFKRHHTTLPCFLGDLKAQLASQKDVSQHVHLQQTRGHPEDTSQHCCTQL